MVGEVGVTRRASLLTGKLPLAALTSLLARLPHRDPRLIVGPQIALAQSPRHEQIGVNGHELQTKNVHRGLLPLL